MSELLLVGFCVLALLIFLLSLVTSNIDRNIHESEWESDQTNVNSTHNQQDTIAGAINTYRRIRQIEGAKSARRETITITILGFTAIFALAAAVAAGYSALIFHQQQSDFVDQEQRQLRAYVFSDKVDIYNADDDISKHSSEAPRAELLMKNTGVTPAYNVTTFVGASVLTFPLRFTMADVYKTATISMASTSIGILPHDARQQSIAIVANAEQPLTIEQKVSLDSHLLL